MSTLLDAAIARLQNLFVQPASHRAHIAQPASRVACAEHELELAVVGLSRGCGSSTLAAGLALALAAGERPANLIVLDSSEDRAERARLGPLRVWQLPPALLDPEEVAQYGGVVARIAGGRGMGAGSTATVWDVPAGGAERAMAVLAEVDLVVLIASGESDPALAELATAMIAERCRRTLLVATRAGPDSAWQGRASVCIPDSRVAARAIRRGRMPGGSAGAALSELAARVGNEA